MRGGKRRGAAPAPGIRWGPTYPMYAFMGHPANFEIPARSRFLLRAGEQRAVSRSKRDNQSRKCVYVSSGTPDYLTRPKFPPDPTTSTSRADYVEPRGVLKIPNPPKHTRKSCVEAWYIRRIYIAGADRSPRRPAPRHIGQRSARRPPATHFGATTPKPPAPTGFWPSSAAPFLARRRNWVDASKDTEGDRAPHSFRFFGQLPTARLLSAKYSRFGVPAPPPPLPLGRIWTSIIVLMARCHPPRRPRSKLKCRRYAQIGRKPPRRKQQSLRVHWADGSLMCVMCKSNWR